MGRIYRRRCIAILCAGYFGKIEYSIQVRTRASVLDLRCRLRGTRSIRCSPSPLYSVSFSCHNRARAIIGSAMGQNSKTIEAFYAAMGRGDIPFIIGSIDPHVVWNEAENFVYADKSPYIGIDALLTGLFARLGGEWDG